MEVRHEYTSRGLGVPAAQGGRARGRRCKMLLELMTGTHPASVRIGEWLDEHPLAALAVILLGALACVTADGWIA